MPDALIGRTLAGKFSIQALLGSGAMGAVYRARQLALDKTVAVKVMHAEQALDPAFVSSFQREARAAARLDHPNSTRVIDFGREPDGLLYLVMEYLDGELLSRKIEREGALPPNQIVDLGMQMLAALAVAHDLGIVHRDLKPDNIVLLEQRNDEGQSSRVLKVCDFGLATIANERASLKIALGAKKATLAGMVVGTPHYMSPEQAHGEYIDARGDIYAVGIILYEMLCGRVPFDGPSPVSILMQQVSDLPRRPSEFLPGCDPELQSICLRAIQKRKEARYQTAREMRGALRSLVGSNEAPTRPARISSLDLDLASAVITARFAAASRSMVPPMRESARPTAAPGPPNPVAAPEPVAALAAGEPAAATAAAAPATAAPRSTVAAVALPAKLSRLPAALPLLGPVVAVAVLLGLAGRSWRRSPAERPAPVAARSGEGPSEAGLVAAPSPASAPTSDLERPSAAGLAPAAVSESSALRSLPGRLPLGVRSSRPAESAAPLPPGTSIASAPPVPVAPGLASQASPPAPPPPLPPAPPPAAAAVASGADPAPEPTPAFNAARGRVDWAVTSVEGGANASNVRRALAPVSGAWTGCFQTGLRAAGRAVSGSGVLRLRMDDTGHVVSASASGVEALAGVASCIAGRSYVAVPGVDTGDASATIALTFRIE